MDVVEIMTICLMKKFLLFLFLFCAAPLEAATIYIDNNLSGNCTSGNYSIASYPTSTCTGADGNAYNDVAAAYSASGTNDNVYFRTQSIISNQNIILVKQGQTWATYPGDMPNRATLTGGAGHTRVFQFENTTAGTVKDLIIVGGTQNSIYLGYAQNSVIENNDISASNTAAIALAHQISLTDCCGEGGIGEPPAVQFSSGIIVRNNHVHDIADCDTTPPDDNDCACIGGGGPQSNFLIEGNIAEGCGNGIWFDVASGNPNDGKTPHVIQKNIVHDVIEHCFHLEVGSTATIRNNIAYNCGWQAVHLRPGATGMDGIKIQNNTFWDVGDQSQGGGAGGIFLQQDSSAKLTNTLVENNIIASSVNMDALLMVAGSNATEATNVFRNNLFYAVNNNLGICWDKSTGSGHGCDGESYADSSAGISSWEAQCSGPTCSGNVSGDPLFENAANKDFRLKSGSPALAAGVDVGLPFRGTAPDIGAIQSRRTAIRVNIN